MRVCVCVYIIFVLLLLFCIYLFQIIKFSERKIIIADPQGHEDSYKRKLHRNWRSVLVQVNSWLFYWEI